MTISFLPASYGDCIHISDNGHHVIIDGGPTAEPLLTTLGEIRDRNERVDLLVVTHYDHDHVMGFLSSLRQLDGVKLEDFVGETWFNAPEPTKAKFGDHRLSAREGNELTELFIENKVNWKNQLSMGTKHILSGLCWVEVLYEGGYGKESSGGGLLGNIKCDWRTPFEELEKYMDDRVLDKSETNAESIILLLHCGGHKVLLPGDATPDKLLPVLRQYSGGKTAKFDLVKLPHHGSYRNMSKDLFDCFSCSDYLISTDGSVYCHPDKKVLLKAISWGHNESGKTYFHFNYPDLIGNMLITDRDKEKYSFECDGKREFEF